MSTYWERVRLRIETVNKVQPAMSISTHILDTSLGRGASNILVSWYKQSETNEWLLLGKTTTDSEGRIKNLPYLTPLEVPISAKINGIYKLHFEVKEYFEMQQLQSFYPFIEIVVDCTAGEEHYHIPLLLTPYGYTTYRGT